MIKRKQAYLQITRECNNECVFCSNPQFKKDYSQDEAKEVVLQFRKEGVNEIYLTGGEPTTVEWLPELVLFLKREGITPRMISNGVNLHNKELVKRLYDAGLNNINISIHSHKKEVADKLSQREEHFDKQLQGLRNCIDIGMQVQINSTINSLNCKYLLDFVKFITEKFPEVKHFVFNNLDPGKADGILKSRAGLNPWIIARFVDFELQLKQMTDFLTSKGKTFRIERVPLCYMQSFEEVSTETRKIVNNEMYICSFIEKDKKNRIRKVAPTELRMKVKCCEYCKINELCGGIQPEYLAIHSSDEFFPIFENPERIIRKIKG